MKGRNRMLVAVLAVAALGVGVFAATPAHAQQSTDVGDIWFCDSSFHNGTCTTEITAGQTVTWNFTGSLPHTVTGDTFDSGQMSSGSFSHTFAEAGTYPYVCNVHPGQMLGEIVVTAAVEEDPDDPVDDTTDPVPNDTDVNDVDEEAEVVTAPVTGMGPGSGSSSIAWYIAAAAAIGVALLTGGYALAMSRRAR